jgi:hypothetical protein
LRRVFRRKYGTKVRNVGRAVFLDGIVATYFSAQRYLNRHKTAVQVTAFTGRGRFADGRKTAHSYAVPSDTLPEDMVLNIALSPAAQRNLHARLNDYIVLVEQDLAKPRLARFVDTTSEKERRPVVDVFFAKKDEVLIFGRQHYPAVNIPAQGSPFLDE